MSVEQSDRHSEQIRNAAARFGLRPSAAAACPRVVAGLRCRAYAYQQSEPCVCKYQLVLDHARMWLDECGGRVLTGEPYTVSIDKLAAFQAAVAPLGLVVTPKPGPGLWHPSTLLYAVVKK